MVLQARQGRLSFDNNVDLQACACSTNAKTNDAGTDASDCTHDASDDGTKDATNNVGTKKPTNTDANETT